MKGEKQDSAEILWSVWHWIFFFLFNIKALVLHWPLCLNICSFWANKSPSESGEMWLRVNFKPYWQAILASDRSGFVCSATEDHSRVIYLFLESFLVFRVFSNHIRAALSSGREFWIMIGMQGWRKIALCLEKILARTINRPEHIR